jgi:hypothetical protein
MRRVSLSYGVAAAFLTAGLAAAGGSARAGDVTAAAAPKGEATASAQAAMWFERGMALDLGVAGAQDAVQAFEAMRHAAEAGHEQAAFNVAAMLDSGRGAPRDLAQAALWYARAAARGNRRAAFNLGQLYERGEGVPVNADLSRAWYVASGLPAAHDRVAGMKPAGDRPEHSQAPQPLSPRPEDSLEPGLQQVDLVWTSALEPEPVRYFVELRVFEANASSEAWSGFVDVSSVRLPVPPGVEALAWRVSAVATKSGDYVSSEWSIFTIPQS